MLDRRDGVIRRLDAPAGELTFDRTAVGLRDHQQMQPGDRVSRDERRSRPSRRPCTSRPAFRRRRGPVGHRRRASAARRPGRSPAREALDVGTARDHDHVLALVCAEQQTSHAVGQHDDSGGAANRRTLGALGDPERKASIAPPAEIDVFLGHQPADVEDQSVRRERGREHRHRGRNVITCMDRAEPVSPHQPRAGKRAAERVDSRRGERRPLVVAEAVPVHPPRPQADGESLRAGRGSVAWSRRSTGGSCGPAGQAPRDRPPPVTRRGDRRARGSRRRAIGVAARAF